jgi:hypothetical protein
MRPLIEAVPEKDNSRIGCCTKPLCGKQPLRRKWARPYPRPTSSEYAVIDEFVLLFHGDKTAQDGTYKAVWRSGQDVGAKFISPVTRNA